jgi:hypothetical protein
MCIHRIPDLIDCLYSRVHCCVKANREISPYYIFVDRTGYANTWNIKLLAEFHCPAKGAITSNDHQAIDATSLEVIVGFFATFRFKELFATGSFKNCPATLYDVRNRPSFHFNNIIFDQALVTTHDAVDLHAMINTCTYNRPDCCIHSGRIPA